MSWWLWLIPIWIIVIVLAIVWWHSARSTGQINFIPSCFGSDPGPQTRAENDCIHCEWHDLCLRGPARFTKEELENR